MNNEKNYKVLIIALVIIVSPILILLIFNHHDEPIDNVDNTINESTYFRIQRAVVEYLQNANSFNVDYVYDKILDEQFIRENNITKSNIIDKINMDNIDPVFIAKKMIKRSNKKNEFYFINGYRYDYKLWENVTYESNDNYLIVVNNYKYTIRPLGSNIDITIFAENFDINNFTFSKGDLLPKNNYTEENKLSSYLAEFLNLLNFDNYRAYELLTSSTKNKYISYNNFYEESLNIYNSITTSINSYSKKTIENINYYDIIINNGKSIKIVEYSPMNYQLEF